MELENSQNNSLAKLPMLKLGEYEMWENQELKLHQNSGPSTALKIDLCLLLVKKRFARRMMSKLEVFSSWHSQMNISLPLTTEVLNVKFLRSLPSEWDTHVVVWMNKPDFETMGLDDLYNNFKIVEQKVKRTVAANNDDKNLAFLTTSSPSSTNTVNTANTGVSTGNIKVNTASTETSTASFSDATVYAFLSTQPQGSQLVHEDLEQIHDDDLEEMDLKWNMAFVENEQGSSIRKRDGKIVDYGSSTVDMTNPRIGTKGTLQKALVRNIEECSEKAMCAIDGGGFDWSDMAEDEVQANMALMAFSDTEKAQVVKYKESEVLFSEEIAVLKQCQSNNSKENTDDSLTQQQDWYLKLELQAVLMRTGLKTIKNAKPLSTARSVNTVRPVSTARPKVSTVRAKGFNAVKPSACWVWRPIKPNGASLTFNKYNYIDDALEADPRANFQLKEKGFVDSGVKAHWDEGFFVGYSLSSKAFRVYNIRTRKVQENLHVGFLENKPMVEGNGPKWLFDLDSLTNSMNYVPIAAGGGRGVWWGRIQERTQMLAVFRMMVLMTPELYCPSKDNTGGSRELCTAVPELILLLRKVYEIPNSLTTEDTHACGSSALLWGIFHQS
ncbi:hypothetical protein Tco_0583689 [Tanacetum coccineum]